jgi:hypothetical protein
MQMRHLCRRHHWCGNKNLYRAVDHSRMYMFRLLHCKSMCKILCHCDLDTTRFHNWCMFHCYNNMFRHRSYNLPLNQIWLVLHIHSNKYRYRYRNQCPWSRCRFLRRSPGNKHHR